MRRVFIVFSLAFLIFLGLQFTYSEFADPDAYYHIVMAELPSYRLGSHFPWLSATTLRDEFGDQHLLYHILLWPFVAVHRTVGTKVATALFSAAAATTFFWFLRYLRLPLPGFWTFAAFAFSASALLRFNLVKANTLSLLFLLVALWAMMEGRWKTLLVIAAVFTLTYGGFVFLPVLAASFMVVKYAEARNLLPWWESAPDAAKESVRHRFLWQPVGYALVGIALGLLLHPQFPAILTHLFNQAFHAGFSRPATAVSQEWIGLRPAELLMQNVLLLLLWLGGIGLRLRRRKWTGLEVFTLLISVFFLVLAWRSRRFIEYWAPFAALSAAVTWREAAPRWFKKITSDWQQWVGVLFLALIPLLMNLVAAIIWLRTAQGVVVWVRLSAPSASVVKNASLWLAEHAEEGAIVFHTRWDQFPHLFFWNRRNYYITGLDPVFLYLYDQGLYWQWWHLFMDHAGTCKAEQCEPMSPEQQDQSIVETITRDFHASYVLVVKEQNPQLNATLSRTSQAFEKVYEDQHAIIYKALE